MGREIRRVPPNWGHPQEERPNHLMHCMELRYIPMYDRSYTEEMDEWIANYELWKNGQHEDQKDEDTRKNYPRYADWAGEAPNSHYYHPEWTKEEATWYQVYETVSEGTPVTPPFETQAELVEYLVANGDFWDQSRRKEERSSMINCEPWSRKQAESFVYGASRWAPSLVFTPSTGLVSGVEFMASTSDSN